MNDQSINPFDGTVLERFAVISDDCLEQRLATADACFDTWRRSTFAHRAEVLGRAAGILRARVDDFARPVTMEMGKLIAESRGEVKLSADVIDYDAINAERFLAPEVLEPASGDASVESSPLGVLIGVEPWNSPYDQFARFVAPNLMAGNVVMGKRFEVVPRCALAFEPLWTEAGAPPALTPTSSPLMTR